MNIRLDKYLADMGFGTRSEVKADIKKGKININGIVVKDANFKIDTLKDVVLFEGNPIVYEEFEYYMLNKPAGVVSATTDSRDKTVVDLITGKKKKDLFPVGRLDKDTEGLLIITNDGELTHHLISPSHHVDKTYYALVDAKLDESAVSAFAKGIDIGDDNLTLPAKLTILDGKTEYNGKSCYPVEITINEGRYHQVKRMTKAVGAEVVYLKRISMGNIKLENLEKGCFRKLSEDEVLKLKQS